MVKAIIFDMDGVLFDSQESWFKVFNRARKNFGFKEVTKQEFDENCWSIDSSVIVPKYFPGKTIKQVTSYYNKIFLEFIDNIRLTPNVKETLEKLKKQNLKLAIATNTYRKQTERVLTKLSLIKYFDVIVGADDVKIGKPEPDIINKAVNDLGLNINEVIFIGDTEIDMRTCKNAKCKTIGFKINGDKRIDKFEDLLKVI